MRIGEDGEVSRLVVPESSLGRRDEQFRDGSSQVQGCWAIQDEGGEIEGAPPLKGFQAVSQRLCDNQTLTNNGKKLLFLSTDNKEL